MLLIRSLRLVGRVSRPYGVMVSIRALSMILSSGFGSVSTIISISAPLSIHGEGDGRKVQEYV